MKTKFETFIGFAIRKRAVLFGIDNIERSFKRPRLIIVDSTVSQNTREKTFAFALSKNIDVIVPVLPVEILTNKQNCKIAAIYDKALGEAVLQHMEDNACLFSGGKDS